jgi:hypothetical protein
VRINRRLRGAGAVGVMLALVAFSAVACSKDSPPTAVASIAANGSTPSTSTSSGKGDPVAFAQCMRTNGVPNFPDPQTGRSVLPKGLDPNSPAFKAASDKCKQFLGADQGSAPPTGDTWAMSDKLKYSQCMRANGLPTFPDPDKNGGLQFDTSIDPNSTLFKNAEKACSKYEPQNNGAQGGPGGRP